MALNLRIRTILPLIISALVLEGVTSAGMTAYQAFGRRQESEAFLKVNYISQLLLRSAGQWAIERGLTNASLRSSDALPPERQAEIVKARGGADQAFREATQRLREVPAMKGADRRISEAESTFQSIQGFRSKVDEGLAKPKPEAAPEIVDGVVPQMSDLIAIAANTLRLTMETLTTPPTAALSQLVSLRHLSALMAENAGRERAFLAATINARAKLTPDGIGKISSFRSQVESAWQTILPFSQRGDAPASIKDAVAKVEKDYFRTYGETRNAVLAAGDSGEYKVSGNDFFGRATVAINAILQLADAIGDVADREAAQEATHSTFNLIVSSAILFAGLGFAALSFWIIFARILRPLYALTGAMGELANGNFEVVLPGLERKDEIGHMAQAVEVFKVKAEEKAHAEAEAKMERDRLAARQRRADMFRIADNFESAVGEIVQTVSSASTQLEASADTLATTADRARSLTVTVAAASEQASVNVQSVASATEQVASSVSEISRQVHESARLANEAVGQAHKTNSRVGALLEAASRIGDVVELIDEIAGQTDLLALNAKIEAFRVGDAGRGFAVVANEVKALAQQTAKANSEIGGHITDIQAATEESVEAIKEISDTIMRLSEISSTIAAAVEEQGTATQEISRNVQQAAQGAMQVSTNIVDVQHGASETGSASSQVLSAARSLSSDSHRLKLEVGRFLESVRVA